MAEEAMAENVGGTEKKTGAAEIASALSALRAKLDTQPSAVQSRGMQEFLSRVANGEELKSAVAGVIAQIDTSHAKAEEMEKEAKARQQAALGSTGPLPLSATELALVAACDQRIGELKQDLKVLDTHFGEKQKARDDLFDELVPGQKKKMSEMSAQELRAAFDTIEDPEEKKRRAGLLATATDGMLDINAQQIEKVEEVIDNVAKRNKVNHRLENDTLPEQIDEMADKIRRGEGTPKMEADLQESNKWLDNRDELLEVRQQYMEQKETLVEIQQGKAVEKEVLVVEKEMLVEDVEVRNTKAEEKDAKGAELGEMLQTFTGVEGDTPGEVMANVMRLAQEDPEFHAVLNDPDDTMLKDMLDKLKAAYPEKAAEIEQEFVGRGEQQQAEHVQAVEHAPAARQENQRREEREQDRDDRTPHLSEEDSHSLDAIRNALQDRGVRAAETDSRTSHAASAREKHAQTPQR